MLKNLKNSQTIFYNSKLANIGEIILIFLTAFIFIKILEPLVGNNPLMKQSIIWFANILMLFIILLGLKLRGQKLSYFGVTFVRFTLKESLKVFMLSLLVFILSAAAFILGTVIMANITGIPESSDMSKYRYLQDSIFLLLLTLCGVYIVSSFGEEVIYRAFLINRIIELGINEKAGKIIAILISSLIFGIVHYEWGITGVVQTFFMGLVLSMFYLKLKKRIWILVLAHAYMDTILMVQMYLSG